MITEVCTVSDCRLKISAYTIAASSVETFLPLVVIALEIKREFTIRIRNQKVNNGKTST